MSKLVFVSAGAEFDEPDRHYRYRLWRTWDVKLPLLVFIMLNPSKADEDLEDHTIRKCIGFAQRLGYGGIEIFNLFAWRATDPADLKRSRYPVGKLNDHQMICRLVRLRDLHQTPVICAWGANARGLKRPAVVMAMLAQYGIKTYALRLLSDGVPEHPLMLPYTLKPVRFDGYTTIKS